MHQHRWIQSTARRAGVTMMIPRTSCRLSSPAPGIILPRMMLSQRPFATNSSKNSTLFSEYWSTLRWKAASALTSALPDSEKNQLLETLQDKYNDNQKEEEEKGSTVPERSIDEAVAEARRQEAQKHEASLKEQRETWQQEAEEAARKRVETDLAIQQRQIAFEEWKRNLEAQKQAEAEGASPSNVAAKEEAKMEAPPAVEPPVATTEATTPAVDDEDEEDAPPIHPILGPALVTTNSKRIHLVSAANLATIPVWKKQRVYRHARAQTMATDKQKTLHLGLPGIIGIFESQDGSLSILDGQHRVGMLKVLQEKLEKAGKSDDFDFESILVEVYPSPSFNDTETASKGDGENSKKSDDVYAKDLFLEVNKAEPVKLVDLPGVAKASHRNTINEGAALLQEAYPDMFKPSQRCRPPHLNIDNLRDALFASNVIAKHSLSNSKALEEWMQQQNQLLADKYENKDNKAEQDMVPASALKKAIKFQFFLGLDSSWYYN